MVRTFSRRMDVIRNGVIITELKIVETPTVIMDKGGDIKSSCIGTYRPDERINWLTDELRPVAVIDGIEYLLGIFVPTTRRRVTAKDGVSLRVEAYDRGVLLRQRKTKSLLHIAAGTKYTAAITQRLTDCGIAGIVTASAAVLPGDREYDPGTDYLAIINGLLAEINYDPVWFNATGFAICRPYADPDAGRIVHYYDGTTPISILEPGATTEEDWFDAPNVFVCVCDNADNSAVMTATATNNNPLSGLSVLRRGREIVSVIKVDSIADQAALQAYADRLCKQSMLQGEVTTISTAIDGGHGCGDVTAVNRDDLSGVFEEVGWTIDLAAGESMSHKLKRVIIV